MRLKILTYNIHKGFSLFGDLVLEKIRSSIRETSADLVFLQEVVGHHERHHERHSGWPRTGPLEYLADEIWPHHAYGKNAIYEDGHHGNAIMSLRPFSSFENIDISNNKRERRGLLHATIPHEDGPHVHAICLHLDLFEAGRQKQIDRLARRIESSVPADSPLIVAGDFNDWRELAGERIASKLGLIDAHMALHGEHAKTFPSGFPFLRLDRIYFRGLKPCVARSFAGSPWSELSDHNALYAELET